MSPHKKSPRAVSNSDRSKKSVLSSLIRGAPLRTMLSLWSMLKISLLFTNAVTILNRRRFLSKFERAPRCARLIKIDNIDEGASLQPLSSASRQVETREFICDSCLRTLRFVSNWTRNLIEKRAQLLSADNVWIFVRATPCSEDPLMNATPWRVSQRASTQHLARSDWRAHVAERDFRWVLRKRASRDVVCWRRPQR